jgi:transposase
MGQRAKILAEILGFRGWKVVDAFLEDANGQLVFPLAGFGPIPGTRLVLRAQRQWAPRCSQCGAICHASAHERLQTRRWADLPWGEHPVVIEATPIRVKCRRCNGAPVEMVAWADPKQRQSRRLQQHLALEAASMPVLHVAAKYGLSWGTVRRAEGAALDRWNASRPDHPLRRVGVDEKWLGRRHRLDYKFVTIVSNLDTGEPIWIGRGRDEAALQSWIDTLTPEQKAALELFAMDMHRPFVNAVRQNQDLAHVAVVHDPFHLMKRAGKAMDEMRRAYFFRAGPELRGVGRGTRWLVLRAWERCGEEQRAKLKAVFSYNPRLARVYQVIEEFREVLHAPNRDDMELGLARILRRTQERANEPLRKWHDSLIAHRDEILALGEHRPPTGRIEALNTNWETLVRRARGYRNHDYLLLKLRFMIVNPIRTNDGVARFLALGLQPPLRHAA